jgi:cytochrome c biogenesis protein CcmG/thiol:disulfide interchange protein DsbE
MRAAFVAPLILFGALAAVLGAYLYQVGPGGKSISELPSALIDRPVPDFSLPGLDGAGVPGLATADLGGHVALINVFASWCLPCKAEHPVLAALAKDGVAIYGINYKDKAQDARAWLAQLGNPYRRIGVDATGRTAIDWGVYGVPETFVVDAKGRIRYRHVGPIMPFQLDEIIRPLLKEVAR